MKRLTFLFTVLISASTFAHELNRQDLKTLTGLGHLVRLHAQTSCAGFLPKLRSACEVEQIRALSESASGTSLVPANTSPRDFAWKLEALARAQGSVLSDLETISVDCRVDVC